MILTGSRYYGQPVLTVPVDAQGDTNVAVFAPPPAVATSFVYYRVQEGDRYDTISFLLYGIPDYWWKIADVNPEVFYPDQLIVGSIIRIPTS
jgi:hypothetical protein